MRIEIIIAYLVWAVYASIDGYLQAYYYALYPSEKKHRNLHPIYVVQRGIMLAAISFGIYWAADGLEWLILAFNCVFAFSFFHNGFYYVTRNDLNKADYPKRFWDHSGTSTAITEIPPGWRTAMVLIATFFTIMLSL